MKGCHILNIYIYIYIRAKPPYSNVGSDYNVCVHSYHFVTHLSKSAFIEQLVNKVNCPDIYIYKYKIIHQDYFIQVSFWKFEVISFMINKK